MFSLPNPQPSINEKKNKSRFFSGFYIGSNIGFKKTAPPFLIWNLGKFSFENFWLPCFYIFFIKNTLSQEGNFLF